MKGKSFEVMKQLMEVSTDGEPKGIHNGKLLMSIRGCHLPSTSPCIFADRCDSCDHHGLCYMERRVWRVIETINTRIEANKLFSKGKKADETLEVLNSIKNELLAIVCTDSEKEAKNPYAEKDF